MCVCVWLCVKSSAKIVPLFLSLVPLQICIWAMLKPWKCFLLKSVIAWDQEPDNYLEFGGSVLSLRIKSDLRLCGRKKCFEGEQLLDEWLSLLVLFVCFNYLTVNIFLS